MSGIVTVPDTLPARTTVPTQRRGRTAEPEAYDGKVMDVYLTNYVTQ